MPGRKDTCTVSTPMLCACATKHVQCLYCPASNTCKRCHNTAALLQQCPTTESQLKENTTRAASITSSGLQRFGFLQCSWAWPKSESQQHAVLPPWWRPAPLLAQSSQSHGKTPAAMQLHCYHSILTLAANTVQGCCTQSERHRCICISLLKCNTAKCCNTKINQ